MPLSQAILTTSVRFLIAYRMQLFLNLKASGLQDIGSSECWHGKPSAKEA